LRSAVIRAGIFEDGTVPVCASIPAVFASIAVASRDVILGALVLGAREDVGGRADLDQLSQQEERGEVGDSGRLLHRVRNDDDGVILLQLADEIFDLRGRDRVERRGRLVHQNDFRLDRQHPRDAQPLLLPTRQVESGTVQTIFYFVPERCGAQALLADRIQFLAIALAVNFRAVNDVFVDRLRERIGTLEHHADAVTNRYRIHIRSVDVVTIERHAPRHPRARRQVVHAIESPQEG